MTMTTCKPDFIYVRTTTHDCVYTTSSQVSLTSLRAKRDAHVQGAVLGTVVSHTRLIPHHRSPFPLILSPVFGTSTRICQFLNRLIFLGVREHDTITSAPTPAWYRLRK